MAMTQTRVLFRVEILREMPLGGKIDTYAAGSAGQLERRGTVRYKRVAGGAQFV